MDISALHARDVLTEAGFDEFEAGMGVFYYELVDLNTIIYLAERIIEFPLELFLSRDKSIFFTMVMRSFHDSAILIVTRLATDQRGDLHTLLRFKNRVRELVRPEFKAAFDKCLKATRFDNEVKELFQKAKNLRSHRIAHTTRDFISGNVKLFRPDISELRALRDALNSLLDALSFNMEYQMLPIPYNPNVLPSLVGDNKTDIEEILDCIARNSHLLNLPEKYPLRWQHRRERLTTEKIESLNRYRRKFGLPNA